MTLDQLNDLLHALDDFLDNYADVEDGPDGYPSPNRAMRLRQLVQEALGDLWR